MAVLIPSILPPPAPFKIFVLLAGVAEIRPVQFVSAIAIGRGARYFGEGLLALWHGRAGALSSYAKMDGWLHWLIVVPLIVALGAYILWRKGQAAGRL